jgi:hypothetical protein
MGFFFASDEKRGAELGLEVLHLLAERGLRHVQALCGAGEVSLAGDFDEVAELVEFHGEPFLHALRYHDHEEIPK